MRPTFSLPSRTRRLRTEPIRLKILAAEFVTSAAAGGRADLPRDGHAPVDRRPRAPLDGVEGTSIALAGRSNVGKSSLINALCRKTIARTSAAPGKTRLANIYRVTLEGGGGPGRWDVYLVDLPGYGYARGGADSAAELQAVAEAYFRDRDAGNGVRPWTGSRRAALLCVDARHPGLDSDIQAARWLASLGVNLHVVGTKADKLTRAERTRNFRALADVFGTVALPVSATTGEGLEDVWKLIVRLGRGQDKTEEQR
jgi:GTP-binding protein